LVINAGQSQPDFSGFFLSHAQGKIKLSFTASGITLGEEKKSLVNIK